MEQITVKLCGEAAALAHYTIGPAGVSYRDQVAALVMAHVSNIARLPGIDQFSGYDAEKVATAAVDLADALVAELVRRSKGGEPCKAA